MLVRIVAEKRHRHAIGTDGQVRNVQSELILLVPLIEERLSIGIAQPWADYMAVMSNCANSQIGVWSENSLDRTVVVAVYGTPA